MNKTNRKIYDFSQIDIKLQEIRSKQQPGSIFSEMSDREIVDTFTYPHNLFNWLMLNGCHCFDDFGNDFFGDDLNYVSQLNEYKKKFK